MIVAIWWVTQQVNVDVAIILGMERLLLSKSAMLEINFRGDKAITHTLTLIIRVGEITRIFFRATTITAIWAPKVFRIICQDKHLWVFSKISKFHIHLKKIGWLQ